MNSKFYLTLMVLGLTTVIWTNATVSDGRQDDTYRQDLIGTDYTSNKLDEPSQEHQPPFYYNNNFDCTKHQYAYGMYADMDFQCQVYHVCHNNRKETFLCPQGTLFNQRLLVCDHWHSVNCRDTPSFYHANQELGKVSNKTKYYDEPYSHRRFPEDYGQRSPYSQEHQFPPSDGRTQLPSIRSTTETPVDSYHTRSYPGRSQSGNYQPQAPRPQTGSQFGQRDHRTLGHDYSRRVSGVNGQGPRRNYNYAQQKPESLSSGFVSGGHRSQSQDGKVNNTWPYDRNEQRNDIQGRQPPSPWRDGQNYPENALLGSRYNHQKPPISQYGQQAPGRVTPGSLHSRHQPAVSQDGQPQSQVVTSSLTYDIQQPSTTRAPNAQTGRSPGSLYGHGPTTNLQHGQWQPEFGTSGFRNGRHDQTFTQRGQQQPQPGSPRPPETSHHPFTLHGGQIHPQDRTHDSTFNRHQPSRTQIPGYDQQQPSITSQYGPQQTHTGTSGSPYGKGPSNLQDGQQQFHGQTSGDQRQSVTQHRQNQSYITVSVPPYSQQQPIIPSTRPRYAQTGASIGDHGQPAAKQFGPQYKPPLDVQRNSTRLYNQQNPATTFQVHQPQVSENTGKKLEFGYSGQSLNHQFEGKPELAHGTEQNASSGSEDKTQGSQFDNRPTSYNRDPKAFQNPGWQQSWNLRGIQASAPRFNSQGSQYGRQDPANAQGNQYSWQKPGSSQYSFQQPQYRNLHSSRNPAGPSQLTPSSSNGSSPGYSGVSNNFNALGQSHVSKYENRFWNYQNGQSWSLGPNSSRAVPTEAQSGGDVDAPKGSQDKNLKPILVYQHHIPVTINGNATGEPHNKTEISRHQQVPVYKVYYVKGDQKVGAAN